jgi:hypothetical protein
MVMTTRALRTSAARSVAATALALILTGALGACGTDEAQEQTGPQTNAAPGSEGEAEVEAFVARFMKSRQAGLPADEFLSGQAQAAYEEHATGLWLHDDTLPGGPGGEYQRFSIDDLRLFAVEGVMSWQAIVRINVAWLGDARPSEMVETLSLGPGTTVAGDQADLVVLEAARTEDSADGLPIAVAETREDIYRAAVKRDYRALRSLIDPETFTHSFGGGDDPIGYWREQEEAEVPVVGDILPGVLHTRFGETEDIFMWPSAAAKESSEWTEEDLEAMRQVGSTDEDIRSYEQYGGYTGWRAGIRADGTWLFFVAGD